MLGRNPSTTGCFQAIFTSPLCSEPDSSGILASIGLPNYAKMLSRSRQTEAKITLAHAYTMLKAYRVEIGSYTFCLSNIGYYPVGNKHYYTTGFGPGGNPPNSNQCGPSGGMPCDFYDFNNPGPATSRWQQCKTTNPICNQWAYFNADNAAGGNLPTGFNLVQDAPWGAVTRDKFTVGAVGNISSSGVWDVWTIDETRKL